MLASLPARRVRLYGLVVGVVLVFMWTQTPSTRWATDEEQHLMRYYNKFSSMLGGYVYNNTLYHPGENEHLVSKSHNFSEPCANFPNTDGIMLVIKTGATELFDKLPIHVLTTLICLPDFLLFSDKEQQVGVHHVYDVLADLPASVTEGNEDFNLYRDQQACPVSDKTCLEAKPNNKRGWNLDKYKFLPMMEQTWDRRPGQDWYVFAEADTYIFWKNMVHWLRQVSHLDPAGRHYLGSRAFLGGTAFAHGGTGFIISGELLRELVEDHREELREMNTHAEESCCGDAVLAKAIKDLTGTDLQHAWPMLNGEKPNTLPYSDNHWCVPLITMHHVNSEEVSAAWQLEQTRKSDLPVSIKEMYDTFVAHKLQPVRQNWDNMAEDTCYINPDPDVQAKLEDHFKGRQRKPEEMNAVQKEAWRSPTHCAKVCELEDVPDESEMDFSAPGEPQRKQKTIQAGNASRNQTAEEEEEEEEEQQKVVNKEKRVESASEEAARARWRAEAHKQKRDRQCFGWRWHDEICCTSRSIRLGAPTKPLPDADRMRWVSGWDVKGVRDWVEAMGECKAPVWKTKLD